MTSSSRSQKLKKMGDSQRICKIWIFDHLRLRDKNASEIVKWRTLELMRVLHLSLSGAPSSALFLPFLTFGPDLGAWSDFWVSMEFLRAPIRRKGSGSTTTTMWELFSKIPTAQTFPQLFSHSLTYYQDFSK